MNSTTGCSAVCDPKGDGFCSHARADSDDWRAEQARDAEDDAYAAGDDEYEHDGGYDVPERWDA